MIVVLFALIYCGLTGLMRLTDLLITLCLGLCTVEAGNGHPFGGRVHEAGAASE